MPELDVPEPQLSNGLDARPQSQNLSAYPYHAYTTSGFAASAPSSPPALSFSSSRPASNLGPGRASFSDFSSTSSPIQDRYGEEIYQSFPASNPTKHRTCGDVSCEAVSQTDDGPCDNICCEPDPRLSAIYEKYFDDIAMKSFSSFDLSLYFNNFAQIHNDYVSSDYPPPADKWHQAAELPILDSDGNMRPFKSLFSGPDAIGDRQLVVFVRHFFCGACQAYLRALSRGISLQQYFRLATPTSITIIGLGDPRLIPDYRRRTGCPFPIYTDPTRTLYKILGMTWTLNMGQRVSYMGNMTEIEWLGGQFKQFRETENGLKFKAGNPLWIGGEFLVENGEVKWCRRMRNYRGHSDIDLVKTLLGVED